MLDHSGRRYEELQQRREALSDQIDTIYQRYDIHIGSRLRLDSLSPDEMPSAEEYAAYDLVNTPLASLETQLFKITMEMQTLRPAEAA